MLPNLSALPTSARCLQWADAPTPPAPSDDGNDRYFYLWHRPRDASFPQPELVNRIVESGGVVPEYAKDAPMSVPQMRPPDANSFADGIAAFLTHDMDARTRLTHGSVGSLAWFYTNGRSDGTALEHANPWELVFRVPSQVARASGAGAAGAGAAPAAPGELDIGDGEQTTGAGMFRR